MTTRSQPGHLVDVKRRTVLHRQVSSQRASTCGMAVAMPSQPNAMLQVHALPLQERTLLVRVSAAPAEWRQRGPRASRPAARQSPPASRSRKPCLAGTPAPASEPLPRPAPLLQPLSTTSTQCAACLGRGHVHTSLSGLATRAELPLRGGAASPLLHLLLKHPCMTASQQPKHLAFPAATI